MQYLRNILLPICIVEHTPQSFRSVIARRLRKLSTIRKAFFQLQE